MSVLKHRKSDGTWEVISALPRGKTGIDAPQTTTIADYVGDVYVDTVHQVFYVCTAITTVGETKTYTWARVTGDELVPATTESLGGIIVGENLQVEDDGTLNALAGIKDQPEAPTGANDKFWLDTDEPGYLVNVPEYIYNKVTTLSESADDNQYPSAKCVNNALKGKQNTLPSSTVSGYLHTDGSGNLSWSDVDVSAAINTHNADSTAHSAIQTKIGTDISAHNLDSTSHNDIRTAVSGKQDKLPTVINDRYLHTNSSTGALEWVADNVFIATYGVTTYNEINDAVQNNKYIVCKNRYGINAEMYVLAYFDENVATFGSIGGSQQLGALCNARDIWSMYGGYVEMSDNKKDTIVGFEEATLYYPSTKAIAKYHDSTKQDSLPTVTNDRFLHTNNDTGELEWSQVDMSSKENISNKVKSTTGLSGASTDDEYPSAKCVYNLIANVEDILASV